MFRSGIISLISSEEFHDAFIPHCEEFWERSRASRIKITKRSKKFSIIFRPRGRKNIFSYCLRVSNVLGECWWKIFLDRRNGNERGEKEIKFWLTPQMKFTERIIYLLLLSKSPSSDLLPLLWHNSFTFFLLLTPPLYHLRLEKCVEAAGMGNKSKSRTESFLIFSFWFF